MAPPSPLLDALAPRTAPDQVGVLPVFLALGKGVAGGFKFLKSPRGKKFLKRLGDSSKQAEIRWKRADKKAQQAKDPAAKKRWSKRAARYKAKFEELRVAEDLAHRGIVGRGPVLEYRRNVLAMEWEDASPLRKKVIEGEIASMDKRLKALHREAEVAKHYQGDEVGPVVQVGATSVDKATEGLGDALKAAGVTATPMSLMTAPHLTLAYEVSDTGQWRLAGRTTALFGKKHGLSGIYIQTEAYGLFGVTDDPVAVAKAVDLNYRGHVHLLNDEGGWGGPVAPKEESKEGSAVKMLVPYVKGKRDISREVMNGLGGMAFNTQSPPGSGRLVRLPFYPETPADAWTGGTGIEFPGDDPVLRLVIPPGDRVAPTLRMFVPKIDYGIYRVLGLQTNYQDTYGLRFIGDTGPHLPSVAITVSNLQLYNGQQLFLQDSLEELPADTFAILPTHITRSPNPSNPFEAPYNYSRRRSRFFSGLRDYPVIKNNVEVFMTVNAFIEVPIIPPGIEPPVMEIPFTANLIVDILEDKVFGDPVNPSPASRAGATVKLGTRELGLSNEGRPQVEVVSPHFIPRRLRITEKG